MINRRRCMKSETYTQEGYVKRGLVFHLDGINKGTNENKWTDLIGGITFPFNGVSEILDNGIQFHGKPKEWMIAEQDYMRESSYFPANLYTIECCFDRTSGAYIYGTGQKSYGYINLMFGTGDDFYSFRNSNGSGKVYINDNLQGPHTVSLSDKTGVANGTFLVDSVNTSYNGFGASTTLGGRNYGNAFLFSGKLYSLRIYRRHLNADEILHNQQIDNERFNLGLNL